MRYYVRPYDYKNETSLLANLLDQLMHRNHHNTLNLNSPCLLIYWVINLNDLYKEYTLPIIRGLPTHDKRLVINEFSQPDHYPIKKNVCHAVARRFVLIGK